MSLWQISPDDLEYVLDNENAVEEMLALKFPSDDTDNNDDISIAKPSKLSMIDDGFCLDKILAFSALPAYR